MNNQIKGMFYYYSIDVIRSLKIFFTILIGILLASAVVCYLLLGMDEFHMYFALPFATYTNVGIIAFQLVKGNVAFGLKMGAVRKNIYLMQVYFMFAYSIIIAVLSSTLQLITEWLFEAFNITNFIFWHPAVLLTDNWVTRIIVDALVMFFIMALLYLMALIFYRTGLIGGGSLLGLLIVITLHGVFEGWIIRGLMDIFSNITMVSFVTLFIIGIGFCLLGFPFMRRITVVKTR
ncbi:hypothetical protein ACS127_10990 [Amphibacillus sp. Q70]|uniref:hypothetical protein n=1 Tax=Amphibacillus sp. Q70 TaxID=3453416 RepID=UPI003F87946C